ncbi:MAG: nuclear transport factor 2 family protein [Acetobacteraceae bacterium]|nr:nuclear transport factor 2 family protein [Acetobacteraceae bacterium]
MPDVPLDSTRAAIADIQAVIQLYLDGLHEGDAEKLARAFHPCAALHAADGAGGVAVEGRDAWLARVRGRPSPASQGLARHDRLLAVDLAGEDAACVKLNCAIPPRFFTDFLLLIRTAEGWRIVQKAYHTRIEG